MENELYRGYAIYNKCGEIERSLNIIESRKRNICFVFNGLDEEWLNIGKALRQIPAFMNALRRIDTILESMSTISIFRLMEEGTNGKFVENLLCMVAVQVGLIDIISTINIVPKCTIGTDTGELICAYYDELLSLEQLVATTYYIALFKSKYSVSKQHNEDSYGNIVHDVERIISKQKFRSSKWSHIYEHVDISMVDVLLKAVLQPSELDWKTYPDDIFFVQFGANNISYLKNSMHLIESGITDPVLNLFRNIGRLYEVGINSTIANIYPEIIWPVSKGTPMISPVLKWFYEDEWYVPQEKLSSKTKLGQQVYAIDTSYNDWAYLKGHVIDGNILFPAAGYLYLVWNCFADSLWRTIDNCNVVFENVKFMRASNISNGDVSYTVSLRLHGEFEVTERDVLLVSGTVSQLENEFHDILSTSVLYNEESSDTLPLLQKDVYKKLKLLGYNYSGSFRGIKQCNNLTTKGILNWEGNWITFIDSMLQLNILEKDTRNLYVPTGIAKLLINPKSHKDHINSDGTVDVYCRREANITSSGGVELTGLDVGQIPRRKQIEEAVTESYQFIPNESIMDIEQCMRVNTQIILENHLEANFKMVEVYSSHLTNREPLCPLIQKALLDQPLIQPEIKLLTNMWFDVSDIVVENKPLTTDSNYLLVVGIEVLTHAKMLTEAISAIADQGYIISREDVSFELKEISGLEIVTNCKTAFETIILLKRYRHERPVVININNSLHDLNWTTKLHDNYKKNAHIVVVSQNIKCSGILGFVNCIRREPGGSNIKCVLVMDDDAPGFTLDEVLYAKQLRKGMAVNVYKDGKWGTYRHLLIKPSAPKEAEGAFITVANPGDMSSLTWVEGPLFSRSNVDKDHVLIYVYYSALNFKDILTASGRIPIDVRLKTGGVQGLEFSGRNKKGERVFGIAGGGALSTLYAADQCLLWNVPDNWTMEEAVTVPVVYSTVLYALVSVSKIRRGQSILIHAGSGGVGQAAIYIALHYGCSIFTTVGSKEKKAFIKNKFPQILEEHIGNSRDTSFEQMIYEHTNGRGVDIALNSLSQEKLHATIRCVAKGGCYLEIGKVDLISNNELSLYMFQNGIKATGVMLDYMLETDERKVISNLVSKHIKSGAVKPLIKKIYDWRDVEAAYRFMASGKHIGKVVIKVRPEEKDENLIPRKQLFSCQPSFYCNSNSTYVIIGGLGGFGLELADWLILKGCKKLILVSRHGLKTGYQVLKLRFWQKYTSMIHISTEDVTTEEGCIQLLKGGSKMGPVDGIFNLAVDLKDMLFENQNMETFELSLKPKAIATYYLDKVSRQFCPQLRYFVVFSSVSAGRGNPGQTNYGLANSIMENICEKRYTEGYPSLAVQWGAVGDVGLVAEMNDMNRDVVIGGTLVQRISNCLEVLDTFLCQNNVIVASMVVAKKSVGGDIEEAICNILGIKDVKTINEHVLFPELGMDSIVGLEIKQIIERKFNCVLTNQDIKAMSFHRLKGLSQNQDIEATSTNELDWINLLFKNMKRLDLCDVPILRLNASSEYLPEILFLPGIEGYSTVFEPLISRLSCQAFGCQYLFKACNNNVHFLAKDVLKCIKRSNSKFTLVAYSFGCLVALEVIALLEQEGCLGKVILIDGSPKHFKALTQLFLPAAGEDAFKMYLIKKMLESNSFVFTNAFEDKLAACATVDEKIDVVVSDGAAKSNLPFEYVRQSFEVVHNRIKAGANYKKSFKNLKSSVKLLRSKISFLVDDDYGLSEFFEHSVEVKTIDADHETILTKAEVAREIREFI